VNRYIIVAVARSIIREKGRAPAAEAADSAVVLAQLDRILSTPLFQYSKRYPTFLRYVVELTLRGEGDELKERTLGIAVFKRSPEYDTSADPVVRNTASEVRKRLDEYYSEPGRESELRIALPAGAYVPEFLPPPERRISAPQAEPAAPPVSQLRRRGNWILAFSAIAVFGVLAILKLSSAKPATDVFWAPILQAADPILVVTDTLVALREQPAAPGGGSSLVREVMDPKTFLNVSEQSAKLASFLLAHGKHVHHELAREVTLAKLRGKPFILRGAFNNQWTPRAVAPFRFYLQLDRDPLVRRIIDRQNPARRDWSAPMAPGITEDYALIARAPEPESGQMMLVIAGLGEKGSAAALEFVTNPKYLEGWAAAAPQGWEKRNIEVVIKSKLINDDWGEPRVVATHVW
jgi:hypothetical protein